MKKTILICGHGLGISDAVARRFGRAGYPVAIVARNAERLESAAAALEAEGIRARAFPGDLSDAGSVGSIVEKVRNDFGPIEILHWNAFLPVEGDLLSASSDDLRRSLEVRLVSFIAAVQASLPDLEASKGAVLATSGIMAFDWPGIDAFATGYGLLAISAAAQHKASGIMAETLAPRGVFAGEVVVNGFVKGTDGAFSQDAMLEPGDIAETFWNLFVARSEHSVIHGQSISRS